MKVNDFVTIKKFDKPNHPDRRGRITLIGPRGYHVSSMNMPFCGSVCDWFSKDELSE